MKLQHILEPHSLSRRFADVKSDLIEGKEDAVVDSWNRLLKALRKEVDELIEQGSDCIPSIDYQDIHDLSTGHATELRDSIRRRGIVVVKGVITKDDATQWRNDAVAYLEDSSYTNGKDKSIAQPHNTFWSPSQLKARAHSHVLETQRIVMHCWELEDDTALEMSSNIPVVYADTLDTASYDRSSSDAEAHVESGSVLRWQANGYGQTGIYDQVCDRHWENHNPWDSKTRLHAVHNLHKRQNASLVFTMFEGRLILSDTSVIRVCPMLKLSTMYLQLRPFFTPKQPCPMAKDFLWESNWKLETRLSNHLHGTLPSHNQELSDCLHPHLQLQNTLLSVPRLEPGDYVLWHPDLVHSFKPEETCTKKIQPEHLVAPDMLSIPACPLTEDSARFLAKQRRAFVLGLSGPDSEQDECGSESQHLGRPGVQDVYDAGGENALQAMGLLQWDEAKAGSEGERLLIRKANEILFPN